MLCVRVSGPGRAYALDPARDAGSLHHRVASAYRLRKQHKVLVPAQETGDGKGSQRRHWTGLAPVALAGDANLPPEQSSFTLDGSSSTSNVPYGLPCRSATSTDTV
jgi:hypothetical protein